MSSEFSVSNPDECLMEMHGLRHCSQSVIKTFSKWVVALADKQVFQIFGKSLANQIQNQF